MDVYSEVMIIGSKLHKGASNDQAEDLLKLLKNLSPDIDVISRSKICNVVNALRKSSKVEKVKLLAQGLLIRWKKMFDKSRQCQKSSEAVDEKLLETKCSNSAASISMEVSGTQPGRLSIPLSVYPSGTKDKMRLKCRSMLADSLRCPEYEESYTDTLGAVIEDLIYEEFGNTDKAYVSRVRSRIVNLRDSGNPQLKSRVLDGAIAPERMAKMTLMEMLSDEAALDIQNFLHKSMNDHQLAVQKGSSSDFYKCSRCGKRDTTFTQAQTRSADEPMTTFVLCNVCGKRWKHC